MFIEIPNYLSADKVENYRSILNEHSHLRNGSSYYRDGESVPISICPELKDLDNQLLQIFMGISKELVSDEFKPYWPIGDTGYEYHLYPPGNICHEHYDGEVLIDTETSPLRFLTVVLHLTTNKDGGELVFPKQNKTFSTEAGKLLMFPTSVLFPHYTTPSKEPREIIMTWLTYSGITARRTS